MMRVRIQSRMAEVLSLTNSLLRRLLNWFFTVNTLTFKSEAIAGIGIPFFQSRRTSRSLGSTISFYTNRLVCECQ